MNSSALNNFDFKEGMREALGSELITWTIGNLEKWLPSSGYYPEILSVDEIEEYHVDDVRKYNMIIQTSTFVAATVTAKCTVHFYASESVFNPSAAENVEIVSIARSGSQLGVVASFSIPIRVTFFLTKMRKRSGWITRMSSFNNRIYICQRVAARFGT